MKELEQVNQRAFHAQTISTKVSGNLTLLSGNLSELVEELVNEEAIKKVV